MQASQRTLSVRSVDSQLSCQGIRQQMHLAADPSSAQYTGEVLWGRDGTAMNGQSPFIDQQRLQALILARRYQGSFSSEAAEALGTPSNRSLLDLAMCDVASRTPSNRSLLDLVLVDASPPDSAPVSPLTNNGRPDWRAPSSPRGQQLHRDAGEPVSYTSERSCAKGNLVSYTSEHEAPPVHMCGHSDAGSDRLEERNSQSSPSSASRKIQTGDAAFADHTQAFAKAQTADDAAIAANLRLDEFLEGIAVERQRPSSSPSSTGIVPPSDDDMKHKGDSSMAARWQKWRQRRKARAQKDSDCEMPPVHRKVNYGLFVRAQYEQDLPFQHQ